MEDAQVMSGRAQAAFANGRHDIAMFWGLRALPEADGDWEIVRLASSVSALVGAAEAVQILREHMTPARGPNYRMALLSLLVESGRLDEAASHRAIVGPADRVEPWYLMNEIRMLVRTGKQDEAASLLHGRSTLLDSSVTAWPLAECMIRFFSGDSNLVQEVVQRALALVNTQLSWHQESTVAAYMARVGLMLDVPLTSEALQLYDEASQFYATYPLATELSLANSLARSHRFLDHRAVEARITAALATEEPISVVRLGDGEGRLVGDLSPYPKLLAESAEVARKVWFWNSPEGSLESIRDDVVWAMHSSDVIGINSSYRIEFEYRNSLRGYVGVVLANRFAADQVSRESALSWNHLSTELNKSGALLRLADAAGSVGLISPYASVKPLTDWSGGHCEFFRVPSEGHALLMENSMEAPHFPDVYYSLRDRLRSGVDPRYLLVAAGAYGKVYCAEIKRGGGIAVDIGAVADTWAGLRTR